MAGYRVMHDLEAEHARAEGHADALRICRVRYPADVLAGSLEAVGSVEGNLGPDILDRHQRPRS